MGVNCASQRHLLRGSCYESNLALCCNKGPNQKTPKVIPQSNMNGGDQWSEKILGFDHSSTISNDNYEQDLIKLAGEKKYRSKSPSKMKDDDLASISNSSFYYESNCELFYIENGMEDGMVGLPPGPMNLKND
mgnify:CR=1 FL=1